MVKQGHFAKSSRTKRMNQLKRRAKKTSQATINEQQVLDFILVRYGLTLKKHFSAIQGETIQRFIIEMINVDDNYQNWDMEKRFNLAIKKIATQVPWRFYKIIFEDWGKLQSFFNKELPAIPLTSKIIVDHLVEQVGIIDLITQQLSINFYLLTFGNNPQMLAKVSKQQIEQLQASLVSGSQINWDKVASLLDDHQINLDLVSDSATKKWLSDLLG